MKSYFTKHRSIYVFKLKLKVKVSLNIDLTITHWEQTEDGEAGGGTALPALGRPARNLDVTQVLGEQRDQKHCPVITRSSMTL